MASTDLPTVSGAVWLVRIFAIAVPALCVLAQPDPGATLQSIRDRALENVRTLPNYTCTSVIERSSRRSVKKKFEDVDRIHLEIAYIGGSELFGWPQGEKIADEDLRHFVAGSITNGDFALLTRALFAGPGVSFKPVARKEANGHSVWNGAFTAAREGSDWVLTMGDREEPVPYSGTFQADAETLRLISIRMTADYIPREFGYRRVTRHLEFQPVLIGSNEVLLPSRAVFVTLDQNGEETKNEASFTNCRQFAAESVLLFEPAEEESAAQVKQEEAEGLPAEFDASLELESPLDSDVAAIGDPVTMRLTRDISGKGGVVVPKGATVRARIKEMTVRDGHRFADFVFRSFEWGGRRLDLGSRENRIEVRNRQITGQDSTGPGNWSPRIARVETVAAPQIRASGRRLVLPRGFELHLKSKAKEP